MFLPQNVDPRSEGDGTVIAASAELETMTAGGMSAVVRFTLFDEDGSKVLATATSSATSVPGSLSGTATARATLRTSGAVVRWSTQRPALYSVRADVLLDGSTVVDSVVTTVGFRTTAFTATGTNGGHPFELNEQPLHFRGFSHHNSIGEPTGGVAHGKTTAICT